MTALSRRSVLAGAATLPAIIAVPAFADGSPELWHHANELARLLPLLEEKAAVCSAAQAAAYKEAHAIVEAETGSPLPDNYGEMLHKASELIEEKYGVNEKHAALDAIESEQSQHMEAIERLPAKSLSDLAAKAIGAGGTVMHLWDHPAEDLDYVDQRLRLLVEAVLEVAGVENPFV